MIADTSFVLALLAPGDPHHETARTRFQAQPNLALQQSVLVETLQVVHYHARKHHGAKAAADAQRTALRLLLDDFRFHIVPVQDLGLARRIHAEHRDLTFVDACGVADARGAGGLLTFDEAQDRLARAL